MHNCEASHPSVRNSTAPITTLPAGWVPLRGAAEAMAIEHHNAFSLRTWGDPDGWTMLEDDAVDTLVRVQMGLLADLTRPASRDWAKRVLAEKIGLDPEGGVVFTRQGPATAKRGDWLLLDWNGVERVVLRDSPIPANNLAAALCAALLSAVPA